VTVFLSVVVCRVDVVEGTSVVDEGETITPVFLVVIVAPEKARDRDETVEVEERRVVDEDGVGETNIVEARDIDGETKVETLDAVKERDAVEDACLEVKTCLELLDVVVARTVIEDSETDAVLGFLVLEERQDGPGQMPVSIPSDKLISIRGGRDDVGLETPDVREDLLIVLEIGVLDDRRLLALVVLDGRHEGPRHKPVRIPTDGLMSIRGGRDELGVEITDGREEILVGLATNEVDG
jgi:hypothetical protein